MQLSVVLLAGGNAGHVANSIVGGCHFYKWHSPRQIGETTVNIRQFRFTCADNPSLNYVTIASEQDIDKLEYPFNKMTEVIFADDFVKLTLSIDMYSCEVEYMDSTKLCYLCYMPALENESSTVCCDYCNNPVCGDCSFIVENMPDTGARCCKDPRCMGKEDIPAIAASMRTPELDQSVTTLDFLPVNGHPAIYAPHSDGEEEYRLWKQEQQFIEDRNNTSMWGYYAPPE